MPLSSQEYARLADHSYGRDEHGNAINLRVLVGKSTIIGGEEYRVLAYADMPSGYQGAIYQRVDSGEIVVAHRGTEFGRQKWADLMKTDGLMALSRFNPQAGDAIGLASEALKIAKIEQSKGIDIPSITHTGHSLGGTLAQVSGHYFGQRGETFNAYGAASLNIHNPATGEFYRLPEGGNAFINHVMGADLVSAASPHYGQERRYTDRREIGILQRYGYDNDRNFDLRFEGAAVAAMVGGSHDMHRFLPWNGANQPDVSVLANPASRRLAQENDAMLDKYRGDLRILRRAAGALGTSALDVVEAFQKPLPAGEPARRAHGMGGRRGTSVDPEHAPPARDMRDPRHPAHGRYRQAYAGVEQLDRSMTRTPDADSERLAAALAAASQALPRIAKISLSDDGRYAFALGSERDGGLQGLARVETATAVRTPVESSTQSWSNAQPAWQDMQSAQRQAVQRQALNL